MENRQKNRWLVGASALLVATLSFLGLQRTGREALEAVPPTPAEPTDPQSPSALTEAASSQSQGDHTLDNLSESREIVETPGTNIESAAAAISGKTHILIEYSDTALFRMAPVRPDFADREAANIPDVLEEIIITTDEELNLKPSEDDKEFSVTVRVGLSRQEVEVIQRLVTFAQNMHFRSPESYTECDRLLGPMVALAGMPPIDEFISKGPSGVIDALKLARYGNPDALASLLFPDENELTPEQKESRANFVKNLPYLLPYMENLIIDENYELINQLNEDWHKYFEAIELTGTKKAALDFKLSSLEILPDGTGIFTCPIYSEKEKIPNPEILTRIDKALTNFFDNINYLWDEVQLPEQREIPTSHEDHGKRHLQLVRMLLNLPAPLPDITPTRTITILSEDKVIDSQTELDPAATVRGR